jgi:hypothetical protein
MLERFTVVGFCLVGFSVIANDSVQTLGTWIASNRDKFKWTTLWAAASAVLVFTLVYGWVTSGNGDISFGRLTKKGNLKSIFPIVAKDFLKLIVGLLVSVSIVLAIHYGEDAANAEKAAPVSTQEADAPAEAETSAEVQAIPADSIAN